MSLGEIATAFLSGVVIAVAVMFYVNYLVDRRLAVLLRRAVNDEDEDWPAPPRRDSRHSYDSDDTPPM